MLARLDEQLFPRNQACRPYWSVARAYFLTMTIFLAGITALQFVRSKRTPMEAAFLAVFLLFQLTVVYLHAISVACLHHAGGSCRSLAHFWLLMAIFHQLIHSLLPLRLSA